MSEALKPCPVAWLVVYKGGFTEAKINAPTYSMNIENAIPLTEMKPHKRLDDNDAMRIVGSMPDGLNGLYKTWGFKQYAEAVQAFLTGETNE